MSLVPRFVYGDLDLTDYPYALAFGGDVGAPENAYELLSSLLGDGEIVSSRRSSNRSLSFTVLVEGADMQVLAAAEADLVAECDRVGSTLTLDPGDGIGKPSVFETFRGQARFVRDDDGEMSLLRRYELTVPALPFPRSEDLITDDAGSPPASGGSSLNTCESTTGWSAWRAGTSAYSLDAVTFYEGSNSVKSVAQQVSYSTASDLWTHLNADQITGVSYSTGTGGYMSVRVRTEYEDTLLPKFRRNGLYGARMVTAAGETVVAETSIIASDRDANGFVRYVWAVDGGLTVTAVKFEVSQVSLTTGTPAYVWYDDLRLLTSATTDNAIVKSFEVAGSVRTPGSIHVASPDDAVALGGVLVTTVHVDEIVPGFRPDVLRRWITAGTTTVDATALWGSYLTAPAAYGSSVQAEVPLTALGAGNFAVVALVKPTGGALNTFGVETQLTFGGTATGGASATDASWTPTATAWMFAPIGTVRIPSVASADSTAEIRVRVKGSIPVADVFLIPEVADFTIAECGASTVSASGSSSHLWVDSPTTEQPMGGWWRGPVADRVNARRLNLVSELRKPGLHSFTPGTMYAFCVTTNADGPTVELEYYPRWHSNAAL